MVNACDILFKLCADHIANKRHECLKSAEIQSGNKHMLKLHLLHRQPLADTDGEGIHAKRNADKKNVRKPHMPTHLKTVCRLRIYI